MDNTKLKKYAELLVKSGGNVQPGQVVVVGCGVEDAVFGRMVQECAYDAGASEVVMDWSDDVSARMKYLRADNAIFDHFPQWKIDWYKHYDDRGAVYLRVSGSDPDLMAGVDPDRIRRFSKVAAIAVKPHSKLTMSNARRWSVLAVPTPAWAKKVFPGLPEAEAMEKLWDAILSCARADGENPRADWEAHKNNFTKRVDYLNNMNFDALRITTGLGTDVTIGLVKNHVWVGGGDVGKEDGVPFFPNIPTEEIFTMPDRTRADGRVVASMPLSLRGNLVENFEITFKDGLVTDCKAEKNLQTLTDVLSMDEGAKRLGEVALVANSSPISQMGVLFYNTLFDENASAHLALGKAYPNNMKGGDDLETDDLVAAGGNDSLIHVDFMFGTADMKVVGIAADGTETVFFDNGEFV
jgi:aminopeptidase